MATISKTQIIKEVDIVHKLNTPELTAKINRVEFLIRELESALEDLKSFRLEIELLTA